MSALKKIAHTVSGNVFYFETIVLLFAFSAIKMASIGNCFEAANRLKWTIVTPIIAIANWIYYNLPLRGEFVTKDKLRNSILVSVLDIIVSLVFFKHKLITIPVILINICLFVILIIQVICKNYIHNANAACDKDMLKTIVSISITVPFFVCIYSPLELYLYNQSEFWFDLYTLMPMVILLFLGAFGIISFCLLAALHSSFKVYSVIFYLIVSVFFTIYIQGTFFIKNLPSMNGAVPDWDIFGQENVKTTIVIFMILLSIIVLKEFAGNRKSIIILSKLLFGFSGVFLITLITIVIQTHGINHKNYSYATDKNEFAVSDSKNFIICLMDATDARTISKLFSENPEYESCFEDFTFYPNTLGAYPYTSRAIPYILTGQWYENECEYDEYLSYSYQKSELFNKLEEQNYLIDIYENETLPTNFDHIQKFDNIVSVDNAEITSTYDMMQYELRLVGYRYLPYFLKKYVGFNSNNQYNFLKIKDTASLFSSNNITFFQQLNDSPLSQIQGQNCFKFIHLEGAHIPYQYDQNVNISESATYDSNVQAAITIMKRYVEKLKEAEAYDNSVIIFMSDHGYCWQTGYDVGRQNPFLMIKGLNESHPFKEDNAPISFEDLQDAYIKLLDGYWCEDLFEWKEGDERTRRYLMYKYTEEDHMQEYFQEGNAADPSTMYPTENRYDRNNIGAELSTVANEIFNEEYGAYWEDKSVGNKHEICTIDNFSDYLSYMTSNPEYGYFISVKDVPGHELCKSDELIHKIKNLGFENMDKFTNWEYHSFLGVIKNGEVIYEHVGDDEKISYISFIDNHSLVMDSATLNAGNKASIYIDDKDYAINRRGINIVVYDFNREEIIDSVCFDTHTEGIECFR